MTVENGIKKLSKIGKVEKNDCGEYWTVVKDSEGINRVISFIVNGRNEPGANLCCVATKREGEKSDSMTDYFPETYHDNLNQAINFTLR